ncbi:putative mitochondrial protein [Tanacetum coccineum]
MLPSGLLQPLELLEQVWEDVTIDFIEGLPRSEGFIVILVVVDRLSKYAHFIPLRHPFTAVTVAASFLREVIRLHGIPKSIVTDRDKIFLSNFWKELFRFQGTKLKRSTAYHPQTDGQSEVVNRSLETYLRCFTSDTPKNGLYGCRGQSIGIILHSIHQSKKHLSRLCMVGIRLAWFSMRRVPPHRLKPYRQRSVARRVNEKLAPKFFGSFEVLEKIGESKEGNVDFSKALDEGLVVTESNETESERHVSSSRSRKDTHAEDEDINSVNDKQPMAEVQLIAEHNILANEQ